jgi:hypothetical protein
MTRHCKYGTVDAKKRAKTEAQRRRRKRKKQEKECASKSKTGNDENNAAMATPHQRSRAKVVTSMPLKQKFYNLRESRPKVEDVLLSDDEADHDDDDVDDHDFDPLAYDESSMCDDQETVDNDDLFFLRHPIEMSPGELLTLIAGSSSSGFCWRLRMDKSKT